MHLALKGFIPLHKLIVVDISPIPQHEIINHPETSKIYKYLQAMQYIASKKFTQRVDVDTYLKTVEPSLEIRHFLMTNLVWNDSSFKESYFKFRNNLQLMLNSLPEFFDFPISSQQCRPKFIGDTFFIRGNRSDYLPDKDISLLKSYFPNYSMVTLEGGHWIHSENPKDFVDTLVTILKISK